MNDNIIYLDMAEIIEKETAQKDHLAKAHRTNKSKMTSLEARRAVEEVLELRRHHDLYDEIYEC